ncbi:MAG: hypothetical protein Q8P67_06820, partial [archaeon]|nr:hypothetical protein [archaeon]
DKGLSSLNLGKTNPAVLPLILAALADPSLTHRPSELVLSCNPLDASHVDALKAVIVQQSAGLLKSLDLRQTNLSIDSIAELTALSSDLSIAVDD